MFENFSKDERYIQLKDGYNKKLIVGIIAVVVFIVVLATSGSWLPDDRSIMHRKLGSDLLFNMNTVSVEKNVYYDKEINIIEFYVKEEISSTNKDFNLNYSAYSDDNAELPIEIIKGTKTYKGDSEVIQIQQKLIRVRVPSSFYYARIEIAQENSLTQTIYIDYRKVKEVSLNDKGADYLLLVEAKELELTNEKMVLEELEKSVENKQVSIANIEKLKAEEQAKKKAELETLKEDVIELQAQCEEQQHVIDELQKAIDEMGFN